MSFVLRQTMQRAGGGGDIVRTRALAAAEPLIGRGSDCDIQLPDLAVNLHHAVLRPAGPGRFTVTSLETAPFEANGRFVTSAQFAVAEAPQLGFGNYVLSFGPGENKDEILINVAARAGATVAAGDQKGAFSLKSALFSQRRAAWILLLAIFVLGLVLPVSEFFLARQHIATDSAARQWSSGPLSPGHHFLEKNCEACHQQAFVAVRDSACLSCHQAGLNRSARFGLAAQMRQAGSPFAPDPAADHAPPDKLLAATPPAADPGQRVTDWFSRHFDHPGNRCASCHTEHLGSGKNNGAAPPPVTPDEIVGDDCVSCHATLRQNLAGTKLPNVPDWGRHPDFRPLLTVSFAGPAPRQQRLALDDKPEEHSGLKFSHQIHLLADGGVARMAADLGKSGNYGAPLACINCHRPDAGSKSFAPIEMTRDCAACHTLALGRVNGVVQTLPHGHPDQVVAALRQFYAAQPGAMAGSVFSWRPGMANADQARSAPGPAERVAAGVRAAFAPGGACFDCHTIMAPADPRSLAFGIAPVSLSARYLPDGAFDHSVPEHRLDAKGAPACEACHAARKSGHAEDVLLPRIAECDSCHGKSKAQTVTAAGADCAECHGYHDTGSPMPARRTELVRDQATEK